jgi:hypothetical protein
LMWAAMSSSMLYFSNACVAYSIDMSAFLMTGFQLHVANCGAGAGQLQWSPGGGAGVAQILKEVQPL